ncbi:hypothetical protein O181_017748 [Austropuccinia psidii MF-1]|uniref:Uncharacterized protein n=1 Tax=Austropuccinia psidii MF-1 TaxID=1389203 RepID=A0A9Q3C7P8_9BASI|nr:hypothetical protein [Austropuccinia psidii MF-1]
MANVAIDPLIKGAGTKSLEVARRARGLQAQHKDIGLGVGEVENWQRRPMTAGYGLVTTTKNDPPPLVLRQFQPGTKLGPIGHTISLWPIWPHLVLYDILAISPSPGPLWPQAISCHHWPPWPISISSTPRHLSLFWAWGVSLSPRGFWVP